ncbi:TIR domain-containing protein [Blastococcus deserti]|uniref:TIR domain-containing protein n=1 Tax=Blastococcus deserti TaxID=2259033 RepID=A0ABW4XGY5_9ACTN
MSRSGTAARVRPLADRRAEPAPDQFAYDAFLSYSRADAAAAKPFGQAIERFGTPWYRARDRRVFLDTATLAGNGSLREAIEEALGNSRALVLLISATSRRSRWVDVEVAWWLRHRGPDDLYLAVLDGHMSWDTDPEATSAGPGALPEKWRSAFPDEPIWVDLRWMAGLEQIDQRDPRLTDAAAQLLASMRRVPKDRVVGEHLRRRRQTRRMVATVIATLVALLTTSVVAAVVAVDRRNAAIEQRYTATSRQLVAQSASIEDERPSLARQLLLEAHRLSPTEESVGALVRSPRMPREFGVAGYDPDVAVHASLPLVAIVSGPELRLYETDSGRLLTTVTDSVPEKGEVAFSPSGTGMAATTGPGRLGLFDISDAARPRLLAELDAPDPAVERLAYAPGGEVLIVEDSTSITFYDVADPAEPVTGTTVPTGESPDRLVLLDDGTLLSPSRVTAAGVDTASLPVDVIVTPLAAGTGRAVVTADRQTLARAGSVADVEVWDIADPLQPVLRDSVPGESFGVNSIAVSDDGGVLAVGTPSGVTQLWDLGDLTRPILGERLRGVSAGVRAVAFGVRSRQLVVVSDDPVAPGANTGLPGRSVVRVWPVQGATRAGATSRIDGGRQAVPAWAPDAQAVIAGFPARSWLLDDPRDPRPGAAVPTLAVGGGAAYAYQPGSSVIASGSPVVLWDAEDPSEPRLLTEGTAVVEPSDLAVFSPDGSVLAVASENYTVALWSIVDGSTRALATLPETRPAPHGAAFDASGRTLVTLGREGGATLWDVRDPETPEVLSRVSMPDEEIAAVVIDTRNEILIAGGVRGSLSSWDISTPSRPRLMASRAAHNGALTGLALSPDGGVMASAGVDAVRLWAREDVTATPAPMATLDAGGVYNGAAVSFSPDGTLLAAATSGDMQIWDVDVGRLLGELCAASDRITQAQWAEYLPADIAYDPPCTGRG